MEKLRPPPRRVLESYRGRLRKGLSCLDRKIRIAYTEDAGRLCPSTELPGRTCCPAAEPWNMVSLKWPHVSRLFLSFVSMRITAVIQVVIA